MPLPLNTSHTIGTMDRNQSTIQTQELSEESLSELVTDEDSENVDRFSFEGPSCNDAIFQNMEHIDVFCRGQINLLSLWMYFTNQTMDKKAMSKQEEITASSVLMDYTTFDDVVYSALAYFVSERNPASPVASRRSLTALIEPLTVSLLSAYDPDGSGYIDFGAFRYFGEYLKAEHTKLRQSLAESPRDSNKADQRFFGQSQDVECDMMDHGKFSVTEKQE